MNNDKMFDYVNKLGIEYEEVNLYEEKELSLDKEKEYVKLFDESNYSDVVSLTYDEDMALHKMFESAKVEEKLPCGSDILFSKTIPIKDLKIICDETEEISKLSLKGKFIYEYRVKIFDDYIKTIDEILKEKNTGIVGMAEISYFGQKIKYLLVAKYGISGIILSPSRFNSINALIFISKLLEKNLYNDFMLMIANEFLSTWYDIEIALLHPKVKEIFYHAKEIRYLKKEFKNKKQKRKTEYIKYHYLNKKEIEDKIYVDKNKKHCLCWYVVGHWRRYQNGNQTFIQGYWKGALRNTKKNYDDRERVLRV